MADIRPARWTRQHLDRLVTAESTTAPELDLPNPPRVLPDAYVWDLWPVQEPDGTPSTVHDRELWMALSAPAAGHPEARHDHARLRLLATDAIGWHDLGHVFADGASPGSREWSGSAVRRGDGTVSVFYTAAGTRGETRPTFAQRVIEARPTLFTDRGRIHIDRRVEHRQILVSDGRTYLPADEIHGAPGRIRAFRDPGWFRDPADGREYLVVAASVPWHDRFMGAVAIAAGDPGRWSLQPPLLVAEGINHEIERPHIVAHDSWYYLFFCTHRQAFDPPGSGPSGLYGFAAPTPTGPYQPLNGSGLVIQNPPGQPEQAYAWLVLTDLRVISFLNYRSADSGDPGQAAVAARGYFGGTVAPVLQLAVDRLTSSVTAYDPQA